MNEDKMTDNKPLCYETPEEYSTKVPSTASKDVVKELHEINQALNDLNKTMKKIWLAMGRK